MSMNRSDCDSRCSGFPVELEFQRLAVAPELMHKSLPTTSRPSPDRKRRLMHDWKYERLWKGKAKILPKRSISSQLVPLLRRRIARQRIQGATFTRMFVSMGRTWNGLKGRSSSVRLSLRRAPLP